MWTCRGGHVVRRADVRWCLDWLEQLIRDVEGRYIDDVLGGRRLR
jgi:hypothetical protein